jgi:cytochrome c oxidase subunit 1
VYYLFAVALPAYRGGGELVKADNKPWDGAEGLEWTVPSPAPFHTFEQPPHVE